MLELSSLKSLSDAGLCVRVSDALFEGLQSPQPPAPLDQLFFSCATCAASVGVGDCRDHPLVLLAWRGVGNKSVNNTFPGPMCSPLRRVHAATLHDNGGYTVTEKSDGVRVMAVLSASPSFPAWVEKRCEDDKPVRCVRTCMALEQARRELAAQPGGDVEVPHSEWLGEHARLRHSATAGSQPLVYELFTDGAADTHNPRRFVRRTESQVVVAYAFDRSLDAVYLLPTLPRLDGELATTLVNAVIDGELFTLLAPREGDGFAARAALPPRLAYGAFDIFSLERRNGESTDLDDQLVLFSDEPMSQRLAALHQLFRRSCQANDRTEESIETQCVHFFVKEMVPLQDLRAFSRRVRRPGNGAGTYTFTRPFGTSRNDGFILTPEHFPIRSGASATQFKWKWPSLLSVDWLLMVRSTGSPASTAPATESGVNDSVVCLCDASLHFFKINFNHREDCAGHWRLREPLRVLRPAHLQSVVGAEKTVVECVFDIERGMWIMERARPDKGGIANSIVTALSVVESIAERLDLEALLDLVDKSEPQEIASAPSADDGHGEVPTTVDVSLVPTRPPSTSGKRYRAEFVLRATARPNGSQRLSLYWMTNNTNNQYKRPIPCLFCDVAECTGFGYAPSDAAHSGTTGEGRGSLESFLFLALANSGGSCAWSDFTVDAFFDSLSGRWEILRLNRRADNKKCTFDGVLSHLSWQLEQGVGNGTPTAQSLRSLLPPKAAEHHSLAAPGAASMLTETVRTNAHYASKAEELSDSSSSRSNIRSFHNLVKTTLLTESSALLAAGADAGGMVIGDFCCGRGGDLLKWRHLKPKFVYLTDASYDCVVEAAARYCVGDGLSTKTNPSREFKGFPARFATFDCFHEAGGLREDLRHSISRYGHFDLISCQFSIHYGFYSEQRVRYFISLVSESLRPGGVFVGTTVSDTELRRRAMADKEATSFGNAYYRIELSASLRTFLNSGGVTADDRDIPFGMQYTASVESSVTNLPEFVVPWRSFVRICAEYGLELNLDTDFPSLCKRDSSALLRRAPLGSKHPRASEEGTGAADVPVDPPYNAGEAELINLYRAFRFKKMAVPDDKQGEQSVCPA